MAATFFLAAKATFALGSYLYFFGDTVGPAGQTWFAGKAIQAQRQQRSVGNFVDHSNTSSGLSNPPTASAMANNSSYTLQDVLIALACLAIFVMLSYDSLFGDYNRPFFQTPKSGQGSSNGSDSSGGRAGEDGSPSSKNGRSGGHDSQGGSGVSGGTGQGNGNSPPGGDGPQGRDNHAGNNGSPKLGGDDSARGDNGKTGAPGSNGTLEKHIRPSDPDELGSDDGTGGPESLCGSSPNKHRSSMARLHWKFAFVEVRRLNAARKAAEKELDTRRARKHAANQKAETERLARRRLARARWARVLNYLTAQLKQNNIARRQSIRDQLAARRQARQRWAHVRLYLRNLHLHAQRKDSLLRAWRLIVHAVLDQASRSGLQKELLQQGATIESQGTELGTVNKKLTDTQGELANTKALLQKSEDEKKDVERKKKNAAEVYEQEKSRLNLRIRDQKKEIASLKRNADGEFAKGELSTKRLLDEATDAKSKAIARCDALEAELAEKTKTSDEEKARLERQLSDAKAHCTSEKAKLECRINELDTQLNDTIKSQTNKNSDHDAQVRKLTGELEGSQSEARKAIDTAKELSDKLGPALERCSTLEKQVESLTSRLSTGQGETKDAHKKVDELTEQATAKDKRISELSTDVTSSEDQLRKEQQSNKELTEKVVRLQGMIRESLAVRIEMRKARIERDNAQKSSKELQEKCRNLSCPCRQPLIEKAIKMAEEKVKADRETNAAEKEKNASEKQKLAMDKEKLAADQQDLRETLKGVEKVKEEFGKLSQWVEEYGRVDTDRQARMNLAKEKLSKKKAEVAKLKNRLSRCKCPEQNENSDAGNSEDDESDSDESHSDESGNDDSDDDDPDSQGGGEAGDSPAERGSSDDKAREDNEGNTRPRNDDSNGEAGNTGGPYEASNSGSNDRDHTAKPGEDQSDDKKSANGKVDDAGSNGGKASQACGRIDGSDGPDRFESDDKTRKGDSSDDKADVVNDKNNREALQPGPTSTGGKQVAERTTSSSSGETASTDPTGAEQSKDSKREADINQSNTDDVTMKRTDRPLANPAEQFGTAPQQRPSSAENLTTESRTSSLKDPISTGQRSRGWRKASPMLPTWLRDSINNDAKTDLKSTTPELKKNEDSSRSPSTSLSGGPSDSSSGTIGKNAVGENSSRAAIDQAARSSPPPNSPLPAADTDAAKTSTKTCLEPPSGIKNVPSVPHSSSLSSELSHLPSEVAVKPTVKKDSIKKESVADADHSSPPLETPLPASNEQAIQAAGSRESASGIRSELAHDAKQTKVGESAPSKQTSADNGLRSPVPPRTLLPASDAKPASTSTSQGGTPSSPRPSSSTPPLPPLPSNTPPVVTNVPISDPLKGKVEEVNTQKHNTNGETLPQAAPKVPSPKSDTGADMAETMGRLKLDPRNSVSPDSSKTPSKSLVSDGDPLSNTGRSSGKGILPKDGVSDTTRQSPTPPKTSSPASDTKTDSTETKGALKLNPPRLWVTPPSPPLSNLSSAVQDGPRPETAKADSKVVEGRSSAKVPTAGEKASSPASATPSTPPLLNPDTETGSTSAQVRPGFKQKEMASRTPLSPPQSTPSPIGKVGSAPQQAPTPGTKEAEGNSAEEKAMAKANQSSPSSMTLANPPMAKSDAETAPTGTKVHLRLNPPKLFLKTPSPPLTQGSSRNQDGDTSGTIPTASSTSPSKSPQKPFDTAMGDSEPTDMTMGPPGHPGVELGHTDAEMTEGPSDAAPSGDARNGDDVDMSDSTEEPSHKPDATGTDMDGITTTTTTHIPRSEEVEMTSGNESNLEHQDGKNANDTDMTDNPNPSVGTTDGMVNAIDASNLADGQAANGQISSQAVNPPIAKGEFKFRSMFQLSSATRRSSWDSNDQDVPDTRAKDDLHERRSRLAAKNEKCWRYRENRNLDRVYTRLRSSKQRKIANAPHAPVQAPKPRLPPKISPRNSNTFEDRVKAAEAAMNSKNIENSWAGVSLNQDINRMKRKDEEDDGKSEEDAAKKEAEQAARVKRLEETMNSGNEKALREVFEQLRDQREQLLREREQRHDEEEDDDDDDWEDEDYVESGEEDSDEEMESSNDDEESDGDSDDPDIDRLDEYELDENGCFIAEFGGWKKKPKT